MSKTGKETKNLITIGQAAAQLGITYRWARELVRRGHLKARAVRESKRGSEWRIHTRDLARFERLREGTKP